MVDFRAGQPVAPAADGTGNVTVADVVGSTKLAAAGRDRDVNLVAGGAVAVLGEAVRRPGDVVACQFGGDGAIAAVPPERMDATKAALGLSQMK